MLKINEEQIKNDLAKMGITLGDTVFVRVGLKKMDCINKDTFLNALLSTVGNDGTILTLSFNDSNFFPFFNKNNIFEVNGNTSSGSFPRQVIQHAKGKRSLHPTCSFAAIGKNAEYLLENHDHNSLSYTPIEKLIELNGKMLLAGCLDESPGFTTVHYAQQELGLSNRSILKNLTGIYFQHHNKISRFYRKDIGGCSLGFGKLYEKYINKGKLQFGIIGKANSLLINAKDAYEIDYNTLKKQPTFPLCSNPYCAMCRATWLYNKKEMLCYILTILPIKIIKKIIKLK